MKRKWIVYGSVAAIIAIAAILAIRCHVMAMQDKARDQRLVEYYRASIGKPFQWKAKEVIYGYNKVRRAVLVTPDDAIEAREVRENLKKLEEEIRFGMNWKHQPPELKLPKCKVPPEIDGKADDAAWTNALVFHGEYPVNHDIRSHESSEWKLMYDAEYLYFFCNFTDSSIVQSKDSRLYHGDSFELFIMPEIRYHTYVELVFSPNGKKYTRWISQTDRGRFELSDYAPETLFVASQTRKDGYSIEGRIGFQDLPAYLRGNKAHPGETIRLMMLRINRDTSGNKISSTPVPFLYNGHNIYGYMKLCLD